MTYLGFIMSKYMYLDCVIGYRKGYIYSSFIDRCRLNIAFRAFCNINGKLTKVTNLPLEQNTFPITYFLIIIAYYTHLFPGFQESPLKINLYS